MEILTSILAALLGSSIGLLLVSLLTEKPGLAALSLFYVLVLTWALFQTLNIPDPQQGSKFKTAREDIDFWRSALEFKASKK